VLYIFQKTCLAGCWWLTLVILATPEAEIRRIAVQKQHEQIVHKNLFQKKPSQKVTGGMGGGVGFEFKL
jgi:hypothetical protein